MRERRSGGVEVTENQLPYRRVADSRGDELIFRESVVVVLIGSFDNVVGNLLWRDGFVRLEQVSLVTVQRLRGHTTHAQHIVTNGTYYMQVYV